jgi:FkbM family methyltransferase
MMNFSSVNHRSWMGKLVRLPLRLLPGSTVMPIWQGRLRGKKWIVGAFNHGCWLGSYECAKQKRMVDVVKRGDVVFDVGAHVGFYTLLASSLVGETGKVFAFEPLPRNLGYLEKHLHLNAVRNTVLFKAAVSDSTGEVHFREAPSHAMGQINAEGSLVVPCVSLDDLCAQKAIPLPDLVKIDVEGAEARVLRGAENILRHGRPTIFLATHGPEVHVECLAILRSFGYACVALEQFQIPESCDEVIAIKAGPQGSPVPAAIVESTAG